MRRSGGWNERSILVLQLYFARFQEIGGRPGPKGHVNSLSFQGVKTPCSLRDLRFTTVVLESILKLRSEAGCGQDADKKASLRAIDCCKSNVLAAVPRGGRKWAFVAWPDRTFVMQLSIKPNRFSALYGAAPRPRPRGSPGAPAPGRALSKLRRERQFLDRFFESDLRAAWPKPRNLEASLPATVDLRIVDLPSAWKHSK
jgi:hypothetical protein